MKRKGFTLVELMVVVAIIAILAAVAIPMYSRFKMKAVANGPVKVTGGLTAAFQAHFTDFGTFANVDNIAGSNNASITYTNPLPPNNTVDLGATLPALEDVTWTLTGGAVDRVVIQWAFGTVRCQGGDCDGTYCVICNDTTGCSYVIDVNLDDLGLDKFTDPAVTAC